MNLQFVHKSLLKARHLSPTGLTVVGVVGVVAAGVMACRATLKVESVLDKHRDDITTLKEIEASPSSDITTSEVKKGKTQITAHTTVQLVKLYALPVALGVVSIVAISGGHAIMLKRNAALATTLTLAEKTFAEYRKSVAEKIGKDEELAIRYGVTEEKVSDTKAGTVTDVKIASDPNKHSMYARWFDESNINWERNAAYNLVFLRSQQEYANQKLRVQGYLLLNDVYEALGYDRTTAGAVVGWAFTKDGDNYVDFGIYDFDDAKRREFVNGDERSILLDFNVDGSVYHLIGN